MSNIVISSVKLTIEFADPSNGIIDIGFIGEFLLNSNLHLPYDSAHVYVDSLSDFSLKYCDWVPSCYPFDPLEVIWDGLPTVNTEEMPYITVSLSDFFNYGTYDYRLEYLYNGIWYLIGEGAFTEYGSFAGVIPVPPEPEPDTGFWRDFRLTTEILPEE